MKISYLHVFLDVYVMFNRFKWFSWKDNFQEFDKKCVVWMKINQNFLIYFIDVQNLWHLVVLLEEDSQYKRLNLLPQGALNQTHRTQYAYHVCTSLLGISKSSAWTYQKIRSTKGCYFDGGQTSRASRVCNQVGSRKLR